MKIDLAPGVSVATLEEADDCTRFEVRISGPGKAATVDEVLRASGAGGLHADGEAVVSLAWITANAGDAVGADWPARFAAMVDYASAKGWVSEDGEAVRGHLEWG